MVHTNEFSLPACNNIAYVERRATVRFLLCHLRKIKNKHQLVQLHYNNNIRALMVKIYKLLNMESFENSFHENVEIKLNQPSRLVPRTYLITA